MANYKAVPMPGRDPYDQRYQIIDEDTGEVIDDAQGCGYRSQIKAYASLSYKTRDKSKDGAKRAQTKLIKLWMKDHPEFMGLMDDAAFQIAKGAAGPDDKFNAAYVSDMLADAGYTGLPFSAAELLKVWETGSLLPIGTSHTRHRDKEQFK